MLKISRRAQWNAALLVGILSFCSFANADNSTIRVSGNLDTRTPITTPPRSPNSFRELHDSAFYSFSAAATIREADNKELDVTVYFWRAAKQVIAVRAYVDGEYVGIIAGTPVPVGRGRLAYSNDGKWDSTRTLAAENPLGYILDVEPRSSSPQIDLSITWLGKSAERISLDFSGVTFTGASSSVSALSASADR